jgi:hypothetical protein
MRHRRTRTLFRAALGSGTATIVVGGLLVAASLAPEPFASLVGGTARTLGTVLLQIGILLELVAVALHERLTDYDIRREVRFARTLQASVLRARRRLQASVIRGTAPAMPATVMQGGHR